MRIRFVRIEGYEHGKKAQKGGRRMTQPPKRNRTARKSSKRSARRIEAARQEFVEGVIAIVLSGGALPYLVKDRVIEAIKTGKKARKEHELDEWALEYLDEIVLGLELAKYALAHLERITTEEDELKALRPHVREWLQEEGYEFSEELVDRILEQLRGYWDKFDVGAWEAALRSVEGKEDFDQRPASLQD
jgi:hypothetical protein